MKRFFLVCASVFFALSASAQSEKEVSLGEVTVKGARRVQKVDGMWIFPSKQQLESSTDGYSLLSKLALPHIRVNEATNSIKALSNLGSVQVRINDIVATREDLLSLDMKAIERIEFIENPGLRYGEETAFVIHFRVRKPVSGYLLGTQLSNALTAVNGNEAVYGKINHKKSEFGFNYGLDYQNFKGAEYDEKAVYTLESGKTVVLNRHLLSQQDKHLSHNAQLTYSLSDSNYVFQAKLTGSRSLRPQQTRATMALNGTPFDSHSATSSRTPSLDLYYHHDFRRHQSLTTNLVGTFIKTDSHTERNEGSDYQYDTKGKTYSFWSEAIYENRLKPFTFSGGFQFAQRYSHNEYHGDSEAFNDLHTSQLYLFSQLKGSLSKLSYMAGIGASRRYYRQADAKHNFWLFRPKFSLSYPVAKHLKLKYDFETAQHVSRIALVSDASIKINSMETLLGNPEIRPCRRIDHDLRLTYAPPRFTSELQGYYLINSHCNMEKYVRKDGHFYQTQTNADNECSFFFIQSYNQWEIVADRLTATIYGGIFRFFNFGEDYRHTFTSFNGGCSVQAYLNRWTLGAYADNGWSFMEGEHRGLNVPSWHFTATYRPSKSLTISLFAQHLFAQHPLTSKAEVVNRYVQKEMSRHQRDLGNMITLKLTYRFEHGRKYREINRSMNHQDSETGILK
ncbi:MAG: TonB-dependent receptor [Prevotella sp.]|nr:TonB-dependent receptor [Prevotella sp.]